MPHPDLLEAVEKLGSSPWSGTAYRSIAPRWAHDPLSGHGAFLYGGRWNPREAFPCVYRSESVDTCIAELRRRAEGQGRGVESLLPRTLHTVNVDEIEVLDLTGEPARQAVGLTLDDISGEDPTACQEVAEAAHFLGMQGIRAPSATGTGTVLAVFVRNAPTQLGIVRSQDLDVNP